MAKSKRLKAIYAVDFETNANPNKGPLGIYIVSASQIYQYTEKCSLTLEEVIVKYDFFDFLDYVILSNQKTVNKDNNSGIIRFYFNNGARFDIKFILMELSKKDYKQVLTNDLINSSFSLLEKEGVGIINLKFKYRGVVFDIRDFKLLVPFSIKQMGKIIKINKGSYDNLELTWIKNNEVNFEIFDWWKASDFDKKAFEYYAKKDALILAKFIYYFESNYQRINKLTMSSHAYHLGKTAIQKKNKNVLFEIENDASVWKDCYWGGFNYTNPNHLLTVEKDVVSLDMNAAYTQVMTENLVYDKGEDVPVNEIVEGPGITYLLRIKLFSFELKKSEKGGQGIIAVKHVKKDPDFEYSETSLHFPNSGKNLEVCYYLEEWKIIKEMYNLDYAILGAKRFRTSKWAREWISKRYETRLKHKKALEVVPEGTDEWIEHKILDTSAKLMCNSFYGYFASRPRKDNYYYTKEQLEPFENHVLVKDKEWIIGNVSYNRRGDYYRYKLSLNEEPEMRENIYIAAYITMKQRLNVYWTMRTGLVYRLDTDGITADKKIIDYFKEKDLLNQVELGKWAIEKDKCWKYFINLGYKAYVGNERPYFDGNEKLVFKGVHDLQISKDIHFENIDWENVVGEVNKSNQERWTINIQKINIGLHKLNYFGKQKKKGLLGLKKS